MLSATLFASCLLAHQRVGQIRQNPNLQVSSLALAEDFLIETWDNLGGVYENAAASTRPDRQHENAILITCGNKPQFVRLTATIEGVKNGGKGTIIPLPATPDIAPGTDNQIVRTEGGGFLAEWDAGFLGGFKGTRPPAWRNLNVTFRDKVGPGYRGGCCILSSDISGQNWKLENGVDMGIFEAGKYGRPRPMSDAGAADVTWDKQGKNADGTPKWWIGGGDRTELYSCPFTGNIYLTTRVIAGPWQKSDSKDDTELLIGSTDQGKSWKLLKTFIAWSPIVMTSTPDGRLWLMQEVGNSNLLSYSKPMGRFELPQEFQSTGFTYKGEVTAGPDKVWMELKQGTPSLARLMGSPSSVLVSYQVKNASGNQEFRICKVSVDGVGKAASTEVAEVTAASKDDHSAMYGAFIQPELVGEGSGRYTDTTMFYWYDAARDSSVKNRAYAVRYMFFRKGKKAESGYLTRKSGAKRTWENPTNPGDYIKGASFVEADGRVAFVPIWVEADGLHGQFVVSK